MAEAPRELLADPELPWNGKAAGAALWSLVRRDDPDPHWWQPMLALAEALGCSERQARRAHQALVDGGWAERIRRGHGFITRLIRPSTDREAVDPLTSEGAVTARRSTSERSVGARVPVNGCPPGGQSVTAQRSIIEPQVSRQEAPNKPRVVVAAKRRRKKPPPAEAMEIARYLHDSIRSHTPEHMEGADPRTLRSKLEGWAREIDVGMRRDGMTAEGCRKVIDRAHRSDDTFWRPNLLSGTKLRAHYTTILVQAKKSRVPRGPVDPSTQDHEADPEF